MRSQAIVAARQPAAADPVNAALYSFGGQVIVTTATNFSIGLLGLFTGALAARVLGPHGRGELAAIQTWPSCIAVIATLGLPEALVYFSARARSEARNYLSSAAVLCLIASWVFVGGAYAVMPMLLEQHTANVIVAARAYLLFIPAYGVSTLLLFALRGINELNAWNALRVLPTATWLLLLLSALASHQVTATGLAHAYLAWYGVTFIPLLWYIRRRIQGSWWPERSKMTKLLRYGMPAIFSTIPQVLNFRLDQMLMAGLLPAKSLGLYVVAVGWSGIVNPALYGLGTVLFPRIASLPVDCRVAAFTQGARIGACLSVAIAVSTTAITPLFVVFIFGNDFAAAIPVSLVLVWAAAIAGFNIILEEGLRGMGHPKMVMRAEVGGLLITAVSLFLLIRPMEIMGAAVSSILGYTAVTFCLLIQIRKVARCAVKDVLVPRKSDYSALLRRFRAIIGKRRRSAAATPPIAP